MASHNCIIDSSGARGLSLIILHSPWNACSFSMSSRIEQREMHHALTNVFKCGAVSCGATRPSRPMVIAVFSTSDLFRPSWCRLMIGISCCSVASTKGLISPPTFTAISPSAQEALLHTDTYSGSSWPTSKRSTSWRTGASTAIDAFARSPTSAKADWRTSGCGSFMHASSICGIMLCAMISSIDAPIPSVIPEIKSSAQTTSSLSGTSPPSAFACCSWMNVVSMRRRQREKTGCANGWKPTPRACAIDVKHSSRGKRPLSLSASAFQRAIRGCMRIFT
mmetsp:Transcript_8739/g.21584  ORF Transcript_8739/g.21584 Transcript_8739/m.21584 type:complete len:279 (+) Transcript_8739:645-1481(+)